MPVHFVSPSKRTVGKLGASAVYLCQKNCSSVPEQRGSPQKGPGSMSGRSWWQLMHKTLVLTHCRPDTSRYPWAAVPMSPEGLMGTSGGQQVGNPQHQPGYPTLDLDGPVV